MSENILISLSIDCNGMDCADCRFYTYYDCEEGCILFEEMIENGKRVMKCLCSRTHSEKTTGVTK